MFIAESVGEKKLKSVNIWQSFKQERGCPMRFIRFFSNVANRRTKCLRQPLSWTSRNIHQFQKKNNFAERLSNKPFLSWLITTPPHFKYVATVRCNLSSIACFLTLMFHKVVWQHTQGAVWFLITSLITRKSSSETKKIENRFKLWQNDGHEFVASRSGPPCIRRPILCKLILKKTKK